MCRPSPPARWVYDQAQDPNFFPAIVRPKALQVGPQIQNTFAKAYKAGVKILFGTDTGVGKHGDNAREFKLMVEGGMPAMEAIRVATSVPAKFLGAGRSRPAASRWASSASWWVFPGILSRISRSWNAWCS